MPFPVLRKITLRLLLGRIPFYLQLNTTFVTDKTTDAQWLLSELSKSWSTTLQVVHVATSSGLLLLSLPVRYHDLSVSTCSYLFIITSQSQHLIFPFLPIYIVRMFCCFVYLAGTHCWLCRCCSFAAACLLPMGMSIHSLHIIVHPVMSHFLHRLVLEECHSNLCFMQLMTGRVFTSAPPSQMTAYFRKP